MLSSVSKMLGEGMAIAEKMLEKVAAGELSLVELEAKVRISVAQSTRITCRLRACRIVSNTCCMCGNRYIVGCHDDLQVFASAKAPRIIQTSVVVLTSQVPEQLHVVDVAESEYIASIMALNGYNTEFQPEMEGKLKQFQV